MFHHVPPTVCWTAYANASSMVNVGGVAIALLCQNIVVLHNVETKAISYFKGDHVDTCAGVSLLAGHNRYPLFAVAECTLRTSIYVLNYPEMQKLTRLYSKKCTSYLDMQFSETGMLLALSAAPKYTLVIWNYRNGVCLTEVNTEKECYDHCLYISTSPDVGVFQYSRWHREIIGWQLCVTADQHRFQEITTIRLGDDFEKSDLYLMSYGQVARIVNDYGVVSLIVPGRFALQKEWQVPEETAPMQKAYKLFENKLGLLVVSDVTVYFVKKNNQEWILEWKIEDTGMSITKLISNSNGDIYASTYFGNVYAIQQNDEGATIEEFYNKNAVVKDFSPLRGVKDEAILFLTENGELRLVEVNRMKMLSTLSFENANCFAPHATLAYVIVGTTTGDVHFISYEKCRNPVILGEKHIDNIEIVELLAIDTTVLVRDKLNGLYVLNCFYAKATFNVAIALEQKKEFHFLRSFLLNRDMAMFFVSDECGKFDCFSKYVWLMNWNLNNLHVNRREFMLNYLYKEFTLLQPYTPDKIEFVGIRHGTRMFDVLQMKDQKTITIVTTIETNHFGYMSMIIGTRHVVTASTQGINFHFQSHKRNPKMYSISRPILTTFSSRMRRRIEECFRSKYFLVLYEGGYLLTFYLPPLYDSLKENTVRKDEDEEDIEEYVDTKESLRSIEAAKQEIKIEITDKDILDQKIVYKDLEAIAQAMVDLINFDIKVTGQSHGIYRKFCLNSYWLSKLTESARLICEQERTQLLNAIDDQNRIKEFILNLIGSTKNVFSIKLRSIFSHPFLENYSISPVVKEMLAMFDYFRFYDMECDEENEMQEVVDTKKKDAMESDGEEEGEEEEYEKKKLKRFVLEKGESVYEHVTAKDFEMQTIETVSFYQMYNECAKVQIILIDALKQEFNKEFALNKSLKQESMSNIMDTNEILKRIYSNMNCMLCLLNMDKLEPRELSVPEWMKDESIDRIMTVDDSEITAINRRKKILAQVARKSGRMLLWPPEYWKRALLFMMDGVLEKLWEEEIKKTPLPPEFMLKKKPEEYSLEEQKLVRQYENKLIELEADRRKYLRILRDNEVKVLNQKKLYTQKLNERIMEIIILKLKYDFAIKNEHLRLLTLKLTNYERIFTKTEILKKRERLSTINDYVGKYTNLTDYWERSINDIRTRIEHQTHRDKAMDRQFKGTFLSTIPPSATPEVHKIYKRRPKLPSKAFNSAAVCYEMADRIISKKKYNFPLPQELQDFINLLDSLDDMKNSPTQLDQKTWEAFARIRRQKIESELRLKGLGFQLVQTQFNNNLYNSELNMVKQTQTDVANSIADSIAQYFDITQDRSVMVVFNMGQVEVQVKNILDKSHRFLVMNKDDIEEVNRMIRTAGQMKIKAMQRVAFFRRQVIYKEWEHKSVRANITYLRDVLNLIQKIKITYEFLEVLRNWKKVAENKNKSHAVGLIEQKIKERIDAASKQIEKLDKKIDTVREEITAVRASSVSVDRKIMEMKVELSDLSERRDVLAEDKLARDRIERNKKMTKHRTLLEGVRHDYVHILELQTILELQRLRTYPTLGPAPPCEAFIDLGD